MTYKKQLEKRVLAGLLAGAALWLGMPAALAASGAVPNTQLPDGGNVIAGSAVIGAPNNGQMTITQSSQNAVIQWDKGFNVGANATVNFEGPVKEYNEYNTLNYDASGNMSQIYGAINAQGGNIYIVNPAGVEISSSAQINVGSLYVSNKNLESALKGITGTDKENPNISKIMAGGTTTDAALMSLGNINAANVTFDGGRIVIDTERLKTGDAKMTADKINVRTTDAGQVVLGYDGYDESSNTYGETQAASALASVTAVNESSTDNLKGYMWVEDIEQLQAVNTSGQYALRNSIDATATQDWVDSSGKGFASIGNTTTAFTGKFDGLDYNIFNLNIDRGTDNVGLFGVVGDNAVIRNVTLVGGSIKGQSNVGALAGSVSDNAQISNIMNSASVTGSSSNVGGIIGSAGDSVFENLVNTGTVAGTAKDTENNAGGLIGSLSGGSLSGTSYNLGGVTGKGSNVGGLVGKASDATLGGEDDFIYNRLNVSGAYNVGGIVGSMTNTTVKNAENSGNVTATEYTTGTYSYHSAHYASGGTTTANVYIANAGGIAGTASGKSEISDVQNSGDVSSSTKKEATDKGIEYTYYTAGNVGGIVGSAVDTSISDATNEENDIRGAHNVGGIAGYFSGEGTITTGINSGGDILATGARYDNGFVKEWVRAGTTGGEEVIIGNMGGIAGYMDGDNVYIASSANRGTVHSQDITGNTVLPVSQAANAGGIVGKIDRSHTLDKDGLRTDYASAAVSNSYNTGDVMGYTGVGGVAGMMYNGEIAGSYNLGYISTTRQSGEGEAALNMGGIVGDTTEEGKAKALLYDVYNKGQIGDETFTYYARHVGGIVGRLSGTVEKAYNTGAIYNGSNVVGGIAGWMYEGSITNAFNTGNITVSNHNIATSQVGGIVGAANLYAGDIVLQNVYNLGTLRSFTNSGSGENSIGGIIGEIFVYGTGGTLDNLNITNAYTLGNIYSNTNYTNVHPMLGQNSSGRDVSYTNTYYIQPGTSVFNTLTETGVASIAYADRHDKEKWGNFSFSTQKDGDVDTTTGADWRIYDDDSLPILNAFLPKAEDYFSKEENMSNISSIQYGTAYDPLLTIIKADENLTFDWQDLGISNAAGIAVYGAGLTLNDFMVSGGSGYFGGLIYSDGALAINATSEEVTGNVALGSASQLYGSSVSISADGNVTIYGDVTATGNGTSNDNKPDTDNSGSISIAGGSVDIYGQLTSAEQGKTTTVPGIDGKSDTWNPTSGDVSDRTKPMTDLGDRFGHTTGASAATGSISIKATASEDGHVNVYYGHQQKGFLDTAGNLTVEASGDVYMDSDLSIGGNLSITSPGEMILDISNIGKVQKDNGTVTDSLTGLHTFLHHFDNTGGTGKGTISFTGTKGTAADAKITVDMWDDEKNEFNLTQYDSGSHKLVDELNALNFSVSGDTGAATGAAAKDYTYIWVSTGEQLAGIQQADSSFLGYNFALKNDIDANMVENYEAIGTGSAFTGTFDGRDNRIIGLNVQGGNAGIFDTIGEGGKVEDLRVYSGIFSGTDNAGAVAGINKGTISNVTTFGNVVTAEETAAGGIVGINYGSIDNASVSDAVTDKKSSDAGGIAGINEKNAVISDSSSNSAVNSAVNASAGSTNALGGIAGVNDGTLSNVDSLGVTTGIYEVGDHNSDIDTQYSDNVGGIAGRNSGTVSNAYNESIVSGRDNVGGILGINTGASVTDVSNAARVTGEADTSDTSSDKTSDYVGGLVGSNSGSITNGRNNGEITGNRYVGGLVGENKAGSTLSNLVNDEAASITGDEYVGGIAGRNYGTISANDEGLVNRGSITGQMYVGGVAGSNEEDGIIANTISSIALHVKTDADHVAPGGVAPKYFGGVVGQNSGTINGATNESSVDVAADGATMVGGIIGQNTEKGKLEGTIANKGFVSGKSDVGGIIGSNQNDSILNNTSGNRLVVSNSGRVHAEGGGAAGIFYENTGAINNADLINTGMVIGGTDPTSITGGLFGTNSGKITNSTLTNNGTVYGGGTVGGLIGENTGDISTSSLINSVDGKVIGLNKVGGLIGQNYGTITGGRTETDGTDVGYYKYQIYNNGTITVGTWTDFDQDGKIADGEITTDVSGSNIGGLVGLNGYDEETKKTGSITAGYNTGAIDAAYSENVGGIAGTNTGTLDQVFNTVMTADGQDQTITGGTNVGGIVGSNETSGTVSNAYNTTSVIGKAENAVVGAIAGTNSGTISNVYGTDSDELVDSNKLVGNEPKADHVYQNSTAGFGEGGSSIDKTGEASASTAPWRQYGDKNPLLKVFLTTVKYDASKNNQNLVYNGKDQTLDVTGNGFTAADDFAAHNNVSGGLIYHNVAGEHKNAGTYMDNLWSEQIKAGSTDDTFNPNNLGYDVQSVKYDIAKQGLTVSLGDVSHVYGTPNKNGYTFTVDGWVDDEDYSTDVSIGSLGQEITDNALKDDNAHTQDVNETGYTWTTNNAQISGDGATNYYIAAVKDGKSTVTPVTVDVTLKDVSHTYGDTQGLSKYQIGSNIAWVNGDSYTNEDVVLSDIQDTAFDANWHTNNAGGSYYWSASVSGTGDYKDTINQNYKFNVVEKGESSVAKKGLTVSLGDVSHVYGTPNKNGYTFTVDGWVYEEDYSTDVSIGSLGQGITDLALKDDNAHTQDVNKTGYGYTWTTNDAQISGNGATNYYIETVNAGTSKVTPVTVNVQLGGISHEYGTLNHQYSISGNIAWVNGDTYTNADVSLDDIQDGADLGNGKTNNVGGYTWSAKVSASDGSDKERIDNNYIFNVSSGTSNVTAKKITITADDKYIHIGEPLPTYTGTKIEDLLVNGDSLNGTSYEYGPQGQVNTSRPGSADIGIYFGDTYFGSSTGWSDKWDGFKNYDITFKPGTLTIGSMPDIPDSEKWNSLLRDTPWDRNGNFRERKAEIHFIAGGMSY